jgi:hypothetical protein
MKLMASHKVAAAEYADYCAVSIAVYREISKMPQTEAALLMREMLAHK